MNCVFNFFYQIKNLELDGKLFSQFQKREWTVVRDLCVQKLRWDTIDDVQRTRFVEKKRVVV